MQRLFKFTKFKLIAGYLILILLAGGVILFIYKQSMLLTAKDPHEEITQKKLFLISNTLAKLYKAEGINPMLSQNNFNKYFNTYLVTMNEVKQNMDTLKKLANSKKQKSRINTVIKLLTKKRENLKALMLTKKSYMPEDFYNKALTKLEHLKDSISDNLPHRKSITIRDTSYIQRKQKGFWRKLFFKNDSTQQINTYRIDTLVSTPTKADTLVNAIKEAWNEFQIEKEQLTSEVYQKEIAVIQDGQKISEQINRVLSDLEDEEIANTISQLEQKKEITHRLSRIIAWIAIIACVLATIFISLIISDIAQSQRYRKALEEAKLFTEKLLENREKLMLTVTHDIKSPLGSILGYIELLNNTPLESRQSYFLQNMKSSAEHILHLANNMLDFSKLESNKMQVDTLPYNPKRLLQETVDSFIPLASQKGLQWKSNISHKIDQEYQGDPMKIRQIIMNLLSNAIKYTRKGGVEIVAFSDNKANESLVVVVKDSGPGMTPEEQELIFKEFTRLDARHNNEVEGTGLGLTITRQLVQLLQGELTLESQKGTGSTFTVKIPLHKSAGAAPELKNTPPCTIIPNILLIDDDPLQLTMSSELLTQNGIACTACNNPLHASGILERGNFNLVMSDIQMPEMDGFELVKQIRQSENTKINALPVIALSAREDIPKNYYIERGFTAYLSKPFTPSQLFSLIQRLTGFIIKPETQETPETRNPEAGAQKNYDLSMIMTFADQDREAAAQIIRAFIADCQTNFKLLQQYAQANEKEKARKLGHKMLPMFRQLAIQKIIPDLLFLERMDTTETSQEEIRQRVQDIQKNGEKIIRQLTEEFA